MNQQEIYQEIVYSLISGISAERPVTFLRKRLPWFAMDVLQAQQEIANKLGGYRLTTLIDGSIDNTISHFWITVAPQFKTKGPLQDRVLTTMQGGGQNARTPLFAFHVHDVWLEPTIGKNQTLAHFITNRVAMSTAMQNTLHELSAALAYNSEPGVKELYTLHSTYCGIFRNTQLKEGQKTGREVLAKLKQVRDSVKAAYANQDAHALNDKREYKFNYGSLVTNIDQLYDLAKVAFEQFIQPASKHKKQQHLVMLDLTSVGWLRMGRYGCDARSCYGPGGGYGYQPIKLGLTPGFFSVQVWDVNTLSPAMIERALAGKPLFMPCQARAWGSFSRSLEPTEFFLTNAYAGNKAAAMDLMRRALDTMLRPDEPPMWFTTDGNLSISGAYLNNDARASIKNVTKFRVLKLSDAGEPYANPEASDLKLAGGSASYTANSGVWLPPLQALASTYDMGFEGDVTDSKLYDAMTAISKMKPTLALCRDQADAIRRLFTYKIQFQFAAWHQLLTEGVAITEHVHQCAHNWSCDAPAAAFCANCGSQVCKKHSAHSMRCGCEQTAVYCIACWNKGSSHLSFICSCGNYTCFEGGELVDGWSLTNYPLLCRECVAQKKKPLRRDTIPDAQFEKELAEAKRLWNCVAVKTNLETASKSKTATPMTENSEWVNRSWRTYSQAGIPAPGANDGKEAQEAAAGRILLDNSQPKWEWLWQQPEAEPARRSARRR